MLQLTQSKSLADLKGIHGLQKANLRAQISVEEKESQGFVFVQHSLEDLKKLNDIEPHVIALEENHVAAYILAMTEASKADIPQLTSMFRQFDQIEYEGKKVCDYCYIVVGQVCVGKEYRGKGLFDKVYKHYQESFSEKYDFTITEISTSNHRSLRAHQRIGFVVIHTFQDRLEEWNIVLWDWSKMP